MKQSAVAIYLEKSFVWVLWRNYHAFLRRLNDMPNRWYSTTDEKIAALVEVGAIPYREKYEGRM